MKTLSLQSNTLRFALTGFLGAAAIISAPGQALAVNPINVMTPASQAGIYTITFETGTWATMQASLANTPWWGKPSLAGQLSTSLASTKVAWNGFNGSVDKTLTPSGQSVNTSTGTTNLGYLFASGTSSIIIPGIGSFPIVNVASTLAPSFMTGFVGSTFQSDTTLYSWATGTFVPAPGGTPVPAPLPLVGAAAAFGFSRRLRSRIKKSTAV
jgi:hypothetical protein